MELNKEENHNENIENIENNEIEAKKPKKERKQKKERKPLTRKQVLWGIGKALLILLLLASFAALFAALWYIRVFGDKGFDSVLFTLTGGMSGVHFDLVLSYLTGGLFPALASTFLSCLFLFFNGEKPQLLIPFRGKKWRVFPFKRWVSAILAVAIAVPAFWVAADQVGLYEYVIAQNSVSNIFQTDYKDPNDVKITFPEEKRNLIYIMMESMETSYLPEENGGGLEYNLIPELYQLAQENVNFSNNEDVGGFLEVSGATWTIGAMVAQTSGVPLKTPPGLLDWQNGYGQDGEFLPGITSITNILHEQGYYQTLMVGSDAKFGGRKTYFETHDIDKIYDIYTAWQDGTTPYGYWNDWWGFEDCILYDYAKKELTEIAKQDQPFAFTMLTVDTHHIGGYKCEYCGDQYEKNYENVISCASRQVYEFVQWIQQQDFYENTTVIVTGDHCSMDNGYFSEAVDADYQRHVYNCFINAPVTPGKTQNRQFSALDMFPTTLAAMGCTIEGDRLGLGVNLFSDNKTLMEKMGYHHFYNELAKSSEFYSDHFFKAKEEQDS